MMTLRLTDYSQPALTWAQLYDALLAVYAEAA